MFLVKYNSNLAKQGTVTLLGVAGSNTIAYGVALDTSTNVYITGDTTGNLDSQTKAGTKDAFLVKYNASLAKQGNASLLGVSGASTTGRGIVINSSSDIFIVGDTNGNLEGQTLVGSKNAFVTRYNSSIAKQATALFGSSTTIPYGVALTNFEKVCITGNIDVGVDGQALTGTSDMFYTTAKNP